MNQSNSIDTNFQDPTLCYYPLNTCVLMRVGHDWRVTALASELSSERLDLPCFPHYLLRLQPSDCSDSRWFAPAALRAAGIRRAGGSWLLALPRLSLILHPCLIQLMFWCQSTGIWLVSCGWRPLWAAEGLSSCSFGARCVLVGGRKVILVLFNVTSCKLHDAVLNIWTRLLCVAHPDQRLIQRMQMWQPWTSGIIRDRPFCPRSTNQ